MEWTEVLTTFDMLKSKDKEIQQLALNILYSNYNIDIEVNISDAIITFLSNQDPIQNEIGRFLAHRFNLQHLVAYII